MGRHIAAKLSCRFFVNLLWNIQLNENAVVLFPAIFQTKTRTGGSRVAQFLK